MFGDWPLPAQWLAIGLITLPVLAIMHIAHGPVERGRLARFARRHELQITVDNGSRIIRYLAITRRWRSGGVIAGYLAMVIWDLSAGVVTVAFLPLFAGWFAGALAAELSLAVTPRPPRRAAAIRRREPTQYMRRLGWAMLPAAAVVSLGVAGYTVHLALIGSDVDGLAAVAWLTVALAVFAVVTLVRRRVLLRPQPVLPPGELDADNAIRSRSLHVLTGAGLVIVCYAILGQLAAITIPPGDVVIGLGGLLAPIIGLAVATERWPVRRIAVPARAEAAPS